MHRSLVKATQQIAVWDDIYDGAVTSLTNSLWYTMNDPRFLGDFATVLSKAHADAARRLPIRGAKAQTLNAQVSQRSVDYAATKAGALIAGIDADQQTAVQSILRRAVERDLSEQTTARAISRVVGLDDRYSQAVSNRYQALIDSGVGTTRAHREADTYAKQLAYQRAQTIAKTELAQAINDAQRDVYLEAMADGVLPRDAMFRWVLHPSERTCGLCRGLAGRLTIDEIPPPAHPNCDDMLANPSSNPLPKW